MQSAFTANPSRLLTIGTALAAIGISAIARAESVTFAFTGTVTSVDAALSGDFLIGDLLSGAYTFESTTVPRAGATSTSAVYDALTHLDFSVAMHSGVTSGAPEIQIDNNPGGGFFDRYAVVARASDGLTGTSAGGLTLSFFGIRLDDTTDTAISDALILPTSLNLGDFDNRQFFVFYAEGDTVATISGTLTSLSVVPEPSSIVVATCAALVGLGVWMRRRVGI